LTGFPGRERPVGSFSSLDELEEELARLERSLAALRDRLAQSRGVSSAGSAALHDLGARAQQIQSRPKNWRGGSKRSDAQELEAVRAEMRSRSEAMDRAMAEMQAASAEARELTVRQQALSKRRAEIVARQWDAGQ